MSKTYVLDTSVLLYDPQSIFRYDNSTVFIPLVVIEELDRFKRDQSENGRNARTFSRYIDELRRKGSLMSGIELEQGGKLIIHQGEVYKGELSHILDTNKNDNMILSAALCLREKGEDVFLVSKDINLRVKADAVGVPSEDYGEMEITLDDMYKGQRTIEMERKKLEQFEQERFLPVENGILEEVHGIFPNEYLILCEKGNQHYRHLGRFDQTKEGIVPLVRFREGIFGVYPKNIEQQFAFDALLNEEIRLVSLLGKAGTGKTLVAIAAGLEMSLVKQVYTKVLVSRPVQPMGRDLGFLPGDINEKLGPWMQPIFDNLDFLFGKKKTETSSWEELITQGLLHVEPLTYIRGRSIPDQFLIVDEAQNLTPHQVKTIITRAGEGTKIVLTGDCEQIDNPYLDSVNNGLAYCVERLKGEKVMAHAVLKVGERSELSEIASKLL